MRRPQNYQPLKDAERNAASDVAPQVDAPANEPAATVTHAPTTDKAPGAGKITWAQYFAMWGPGG